MLVTDNEILNPAIHDLPPKDLVKRLCEAKGSDYNNVKYSSHGKDFFIKYNNTTMAEAHAQLFFFTQVKANPTSTIRIPEIFHAWREPLDGTVYIVMEHINIEHFASDEQRAQAITELITIKPPPGVFGSFNGKPIQHPFFKDREAHIVYSSATQLEAFVNRVLAFLPDTSNRCLTVDFSNEPLVCYYADIYRENFPVDVDGQLWVVDFQYIGVLPSSFMSFSLDIRFKHPLPAPVRKTIPIERSKNLKPMYRAYGLIQMAVSNFCHDNIEEESKAAVLTSRNLTSESLADICVP
ncbi:hypothetical protein AJ80_03835 [Polytolypa hystricis UAMH7299]|uniref:Aminoglycoside phosphotransferase domain-containing protein n=1 Tax=Polytolypa hystricis (strain UAMH7299) TaxID=1447883 RepID=A0A2B7YEQ7_POLH7|nr:hypothetical protein AJ80_03835 [Polytolypa hystricis UAMH7299]